MLIFKFLHIVSMFLAVGLTVGTELLLHRVANSGDVRAFAPRSRWSSPLASRFR